MKTALTVLFTLLLLSTLAFAAEKSDEKDAAKQAEMMKKFQEFSTPAAGHAVFKTMAGTWKYTSKMWQKEDAKPEETKGTSTIKLIMGGRFIQQDVKGKAMGMPFQGIGFMGFNNMTKKYESTWIDNFSTGTMRGTGTFDDKTQTLKEEGEFACPMTGEEKEEYRSEWKIIDKNNMVYSMFGKGIDGGKVFKTMELTYKRAK